jgi:hypothetical protein
VSRAALSLPAAPSGDSADGPSRLFEVVDAPGDGGPLRIEYSLDAELTRHVFRVLEDGKVALGHVIVLDPASGRVLAYASTDTQRFPATRTYPAASLVKVITAAAALGADPYTARLPCRFSGSPYRLTPSRIDPPRSGGVVSLRQALATSNNQCLAQLAVHSVGVELLLDTISRFGWTHEPAPAHAAGIVDDPEGDRFGVGKLGCGLAGCQITPLHAAQLAGALAFGEVVEPRWIDASMLRARTRAGRAPPGALARAGRRAAEHAGRHHHAWHGAARLPDPGRPAAAGARPGRGQDREPLGHGSQGPLRVVHRRGPGRGRGGGRRGGGAARPLVAECSQVASEVLRGVFCERGVGRRGPDHRAAAATRRRSSTRGRAAGPVPAGLSRQASASRPESKTPSAPMNDTTRSARLPARRTVLPPRPAWW